MTDQPYSALPATAFWRTAVAEKPPLEISGLWKPKFPITRTDRIVTAGSCFAQHIGRALKAEGYGWFDAEPAPHGLPNPATFNFGLFSIRTGNIYTAAMLRQWLEWALGPDQDQARNLEVWEQDGRYFDAFRPLIEPNGFASEKEVIDARESTFAAIRRALKADVFVFTLGLTEAWRNRETGVIYAACPGTLGGVYDPERHHFVNFGFLEIELELERAIKLARSVNPALRFLLTVSPVPLTATASGEHVLTATTYSKSVLRAVAGQVAGQDDAIDYFPSYEIITSPPFGAMFFADNKREIAPHGVAHVMACFFSELADTFPELIDDSGANVPTEEPEDEDDVVCEEILLEAFNRHG